MKYTCWHKKEIVQFTKLHRAYSCMIEYHHKLSTIMMPNGWSHSKHTTRKPGWQLRWRKCLCYTKRSHSAEQIYCKPIKREDYQTSRWCSRCRVSTQYTGEATNTCCSGAQHSVTGDFGSTSCSSVSCCGCHSSQGNHCHCSQVEGSTSTLCHSARHCSTPPATVWGTSYASSYSTNKKGYW